MGLFDDALKKSVPNGDLATPIAVVAGALILGKMFGGLHMPGASAGACTGPRPQPSARRRRALRPKRPHRQT